ncbi:hypothetical protein E8P82_01320 [Arthrobacter echini]|uniref:Uncharacterized protein n=1 Tax=Arthrobacter echini TaxID=1529066 RepID=A0A4S5EAG3_9MICC|nr:hypothetical protein [Arthrobacter echini]THJ68580.1 hypothetical protein E8P82_01320 [Arthrobacter echini]
MSQDEPGTDPGTFTPWPRPIPLDVLSGVKKVLLVAVILVGVHQLFPATSIGSSLSSTFTLLVVLSWLGPVGRLLATKRWTRKSAEE